MLRFLFFFGYIVGFFDVNEDKDFFWSGRGNDRFIIYFIVEDLGGMRCWFLGLFFIGGF